MLLAETETMKVNPETEWLGMRRMQDDTGKLKTKGGTETWRNRGSMQGLRREVGILRLAIMNSDIHHEDSALML